MATAKFVSGEVLRPCLSARIQSMRARVTWFSPEMGGRVSGPPAKGEYRPNALFLSPREKTDGGIRPEYGSVRFFLASYDPTDVELDFWSPQDLSTYIYDDSPFIVMEGPRPVAYARMYEDDQNPT